MKRLSFFMFVVLFSNLALRATDMPQWSDYANTLLSSMNDMSNQFAADMDLYASMITEIDQLNENFDGSEQSRRGLWLSITSLFNHSAQVAAEAAAQMEEVISQKDELIHELKQQLKQLLHETKAEIEALNETIDQLNQDLNAAHEAYATLVDNGNALAQEVIAQLSALKLQYCQMIDQRALFLAAVGRLMDNVNQYISDNAADVSDGQESDDAQAAPTSDDSSAAPVADATSADAVAPEQTDAPSSPSVTVVIPAQNDSQDDTTSTDSSVIVAPVD